MLGSATRAAPSCISARGSTERACVSPRRMKLLLYTLFRAANEEGLPVVRPLFFADPRDPRLRTVDDAFLLGEDLLVAPVVDELAEERTVLFPDHPGGWFPFPVLARVVVNCDFVQRAPRPAGGSARSRGTDRGRSRRTAPCASPHARRRAGTRTAGRCRAAGRGPLRAAHAASVGRRRAQQPHERVQRVGAPRVLALDGRGPALAGLLADEVHNAALEPSRDRALLQPARAAHHRGEEARGAARGRGHAPQQHGEPRAPLDRALAGDGGGNAAGRGARAPRARRREPRLCAPLGELERSTWRRTT